MPRSSPSSSEGPGFAGAGELRTCVFSTNAIPGCPVQTRTGLNAATDMTGFRFALTALDWLFSTDTFMRVSDVADTFFNVPLHPNVWPFFCRFFSAPDSDVEHLYLHTCADFGAAGTPGIFHLFCVRCVVLTAPRCSLFRWRCTWTAIASWGRAAGASMRKCTRSRHGRWTWSPS